MLVSKSLYPISQMVSQKPLWYYVVPWLQTDKLFRLEGVHAQEVPCHAYLPSETSCAVPELCTANAFTGESIS